MPDIQSLMGAVILIAVWCTKLRRRQSVSKQKTQKFDMEGDLRAVEVWEQCQVTVSNNFVALENINNSEDICRAWVYH
jgi:hypothetical protein